MSDAGIEVEEDILEKYNLSNIDILKAGHHGSKTSSSAEFIDSINSKYSINKSDLNTYYNVGKILSEAGKHYGGSILKEYSKRLTFEIGTGYGISNLKRMRQFYYIIEKGVAVPHQLSWYHVLSLLPIKDINEINYYIDVSIKQSLSYRDLRNKIKNNEYHRLDTETKLIN